MRLVASVPTLSASPYSAVVHISGHGLSRESAGGAGSVVYALSVSLCTPTEGGYGGGLELTITGNIDFQLVTHRLLLFRCAQSPVGMSEYRPPLS